MSHIVTIKAQMKDPAAIVAACSRMKLDAPVSGNHAVFGVMKTGTAVRLPGWIFPIVIDPATGNIDLDNYNGAWGKAAELDRFRQAYAVSKATIEARRKGYTTTEKTKADGTIEVHINAR